jgi:hypothetical protein
MADEEVRKNEITYPRAVASSAKAGALVCWARNGELLYGRRWPSRALTLEEAGERKGSVSARWRHAHCLTEARQYEAVCDISVRFLTDHSIHTNYAN